MKEEEKVPAKKHDRRKLTLILLGGLFGVLLLLAGSGWFAKPKENTAATRSDAEELEAYRESVEERIAALCCSVDGVSEVRVAVTLSGGFETVYATEIKNGSEVYATVGSGSSAEALVISRDPPAVVGIGVVCRGGGNAGIRNELTALLAAAFRVPTNRIRISEGKSG